jgi:D-threo-aldose 1-dehydrogenase
MYPRHFRDYPIANTQYPVTFHLSGEQTVSSSIPVVQVGKSALQVPRLGVGLAPISNLYNPVSQEQATEMILWAVEHGMNFFDTAPMYGAGLSERRTGIALHGIARDRYLLQTKVGRIVREDGSIYFDFSRDGILRSIEESLKRLGVDRIDSLLVHDPDVNHEEENFRQVLDEAFPTLADLRSQGVIKAIGAGMNQWQMEWEFARNFDVDCFLLAGRYTLLEQTSLDFLDYCHEHQIGVFLGGVYNSGILATGPVEGARYQYKPAPEEILEKTRRIQAICQRYHIPLRTAAVHFAAAHPAIKSLILGSVNRAEAEDNRQIWETEIPAALWQDLHEAGLIEADAPTPA